MAESTRGAVQLPRFVFGGVEFFSDLRLGEFRAVTNFINKAQHSTAAAAKSCARQAGVVRCMKSGTNVILSLALKEKVLSCVRCGEVLGWSAKD